MRRMALVLALTVVPLARADDGKALSPFLDDRTVAVLRVDLGKVEVAKLVQRLAKGAKLEPGALAKTTKSWSDLVAETIKDGASVVYVVVSLADTPDEVPFLVVPTSKGAQLDRLTKRLGELKKFEPTLGVSRVGSTLLVSSAATFKRLQKLKPTPRPDVLAGLAKDPPPARLVLVPTTDARRVLEEVVPTIPAEIGGGSIRPLSRGLRWVTLDLDVAPSPGATLTVRGRDAESIKEIDELLTRMVRALSVNKEVVAWVPGIGKLADLWKPTREGDRLVVRWNEGVLAEAMKPYAEQLIANEQQSRLSVQMRQLLAAMLAYEAKHGTYPAHASYDKSGKPLLSWRVHLLPFLGEEKLYKEFKLDEPWDSPHNKPLLPRMPAVYRHGDEKQRTTYLAPLGENLMFPGARGVRVAEINDGTAYTILLVEVDAAKAVEWTKPVDLKVDEKDPRKSLSSRHDGRILVGMADGSVRFLAGNVEAFPLWGLFTRNQGEVIDLP